MIELSSCSKYGMAECFSERQVGLGMSRFARVPPVKSRWI